MSNLKTRMIHKADIIGWLLLDENTLDENTGLLLHNVLGILTLPASQFK